MSEKNQLLKTLEEHRIVAVIRADDAESLVQVGKALLAGGVTFMEITLTTPGAFDGIARCSEELPNMIIGAGTVLSCKQAEEAIDQGARYIVSPVTDPELIKLCNKKGILVMPGALTPTEILHAWSLGADVVKIFPAGIGGPKYFKDLKGPLPEIKIMPTGGVNFESAPNFIKAGACAVGVGGALAGRDAIQNKDFEKISSNARKWVELLSE